MIVCRDDSWRIPNKPLSQSQFADFLKESAIRG